MPPRFRDQITSRNLFRGSLALWYLFFTIGLRSDHVSSTSRTAVAILRRLTTCMKMASGPMSSPSSALFERTMSKIEKSRRKRRKATPTCPPDVSVETTRPDPRVVLKIDSDVSSYIDNTADNELTTDSHTARSKLTSFGDGSSESRSLSISSFRNATDDESDLIVSVVSWNLAEESPAEDDASFIRLFRRSRHHERVIGSDLVLISGQECENIKPRRSEGHRSREFRRLMIKMLGKQFVPIAMHQLGGIQFGLFCRRNLISDIEKVSVADVTCGVGNVFHNKGAIGAFVQLRGRDLTSANRAQPLRMLFIAAHMAAHVKNSEARDADYWRISTELEAQAPVGFLVPGEHERYIGNGARRNNLMEACDRMFFCGDLNYRVDLPRELVDHALGRMAHLRALNSEYEVEGVRHDLLRYDQLLGAMSEHRAFPDLAEGKISFWPTFKYDKQSNEYDTSHKQRVPAWTDRVLFKPVGTRVLEYSCVPSAQHSDHRPVFASFRVSR